MPTKILGVPRKMLNFLNPLTMNNSSISEPKERFQNFRSPLRTTDICTEIFR